MRNELRAELSIKLLELGKAIDAGMPYNDIKKIYSEIKELQLKITLLDIPEQKGVEAESPGKLDMS